MMNLLWEGNEWQVINCIVQATIAMSAWITIILTRRQVSSTTKIKLKMDMDFQIKMKNDVADVEIVLHIINLGMAPVYIEEWGIKIKKSKRRCHNIRICEERLRLVPGKPYGLYDNYPKNKINDVADLHDKVCPYIKCRLGETYCSKKKVRYSEFEHNYKKVADSAHAANTETGNNIW